MPFTPSHAVVALAFLRTPLVPAAVAIGAMSPDLPLFLRGIVPPYVVTHGIEGFPITLALAFALLLLWRCVLRPAVADLVPLRIAERLPLGWSGGAAGGMRETLAPRSAPTRVSIGGAAWTLVSLALGICTHIAWDAFTHEGRWGVAAIPALDEQWGPALGYKWLQHASSAIGLAILAIWALLRLRKQAPHRIAPRIPSAVRWGWWISLPVILLGAWGIGLAAYGPLDAEFTPAHLAYRVLPAACGAWGVLTLSLALTAQVLGATRTVRREA